MHEYWDIIILFYSSAVKDSQIRIYGISYLVSPLSKAQ